MGSSRVQGPASTVLLRPGGRSRWGLEAEPEAPSGGFYQEGGWPALATWSEPPDRSPQRPLSSVSVL